MLMVTKEVFARYSVSLKVWKDEADLNGGGWNWLVTDHHSAGTIGSGVAPSQRTAMSTAADSFERWAKEQWGAKWGDSAYRWKFAPDPLRKTWGFG
jgi:hypothetical protein